MAAFLDKNGLDISTLASAISLSRPTVMQYLAILEITYVIRHVPAFAGGEKPAAQAKKLYFCDNGIASVLTTISEGTSFENAIYNLLRSYGRLNYPAKGSEYEIDFIPTSGERAAGLEVKYHPIQSDNQKLKRIAAKHALAESWLVGKYPTPGFSDFIWGGSIF